MTRGPAVGEMARNVTLIAFLLAILSVAVSVQAQQGERRIALVIGEAKYSHVPALQNTVNDARLIATTLKNLGFELIGGRAMLDLNRLQFEQAIRNFGAQLPGSTVAVFYYAGHGLQIQGTNYLVPIEANPTKVADADFELIDANAILRQMDDGGARLSMVILDACRNNPFGDRGLRDLSRGLAQMAAPRGTLIAYATQPGNVASDGPEGGDGPYALALAKAMKQPQRDVFQVFNTVGNDVYRMTNGAQQPWLSSSPIEGDFYFAGTGSAATANAAEQPQPSAPPGNADERVALPGNGAQPAPPSNRGQFDGTWRLGVSCSPTPVVPEGYRGVLSLTIAGNRISGTSRGKHGAVVAHHKLTFSDTNMIYEGTVNPDGTLTIKGHDTDFKANDEQYEGKIERGLLEAQGTKGIVQCTLNGTTLGGGFDGTWRREDAA